MKIRTMLGVVVLLSAGSLVEGAPPQNKPGKGPPAWAPAHGARAKHSYRYFPGAEVYHRPSDGVWFHYENGRWVAGARLPAGIEVNVRSAVTLEMDTDKPYAFHRDVKGAYPGGTTSDPGKPAKGKSGK